jgi:hypothetical protein
MEELLALVDVPGGSEPLETTALGFDAFEQALDVAPARKPEFAALLGSEPMRRCDLVDSLGQESVHVNSPTTAVRGAAEQEEIESAPGDDGQRTRRRAIDRTFELRAVERAPGQDRADLQFEDLERLVSECRGFRDGMRALLLLMRDRRSRRLFRTWRWI